MMSSPAPSSSHLKSRRLLLVLHFVSLCLLSVPNGITWYFGNLVVYLNSYWYAEQRAPTFISQWVISVFIIMYVSGLILAGHLIKRFDSRIISFIGIVMFSIGVFSSHVTVRYSQTTFVATFGGVTGLGYGFLQSEILTRLPAVMTTHFEIAYAGLKTCMSGGAILIQWVVTYYINPYNEVADVSISDKFKVFSDKSVIDRVPDTFIYLGILTVACHSTGFLLTVLLKDKGLAESTKKSVPATKEIDEEVHESSSLTPEGNNYYYNMDKGGSKHIAGSNETVLSTEKVKKTEEGQGHCQQKSSPTERISNISKKQDQLERGSDSSSSNERGENKDFKQIDLNPLKMVKTVSFYIFWFCVFANDSTYVVILNFYKIFAELWIQDDHFLTHLGMAFLFSVIVLRLVWAVIMDRFGAKKSHIFLTGSLSVMCSFYYFAPQINRWLFAFMTCFLGALVSAVYLIFPTMTLRLFGPSHFAANYGIVLTSNIVLNLMAPEAAEFLLHYFGWSAIFMSTAVLNVIALFANLFGLQNVPNNSK